MERARVLILWNQTDEDVVEHWRREGRRAPDWDASKIIEPWDTVAEEIELIAECVRGAGHHATAVNIHDDLKVMLDAISDEKPDVVLNLVEWFHDDLEHENHVPALFELLGISYTGNRPIALSLCQKKPHAKAIIRNAGLPTPRGILVTGPAAPKDLDLRYPLIIKPAFEDASGGIDAGSVVHNRAELDARIATVHGEHKMAALVEEFIEGREIHCAIIGNDPPRALPLYEMRFKGGTDNEGRKLPNIITYRAKWDPFSRDYHAMESKCPVEDLDAATVAHIQSIAIRAYEALGCRDYARVDLRVDAKTNEPFILEVNPNPDLADSCAFAQCVRASGQTYEQAIQQIVGFALARSKEKPQPVGGLSYEVMLREYLGDRTKIAR